MDDFDVVWNRATQWDAPAIRTHEGDAALHVALTFHGAVMNGGLLDAVENHAQDEEFPLTRVASAYRFLGLAGVADAVDRAHERLRELQDVPRTDRLWEDAEEGVDVSYALDDAGLDAAARTVWSCHPGRFAPLDRAEQA